MTNDRPTATERLASFISELQIGNVGSDVIAALRLAALDCIGVTIAGVKEPVAEIARQLAVNVQVHGATILGFGGTATVASTAFVNGTLSHACDYDDSSFSMWGHPTAPVLAAALAASEWKGRIGLDFLSCLLVGLETEKAIGLLIQPEHYKRGWHPTGTLGIFGATAAACKALKLTASQTANALGIATSRSAGIRINVGTSVKPMHVGFSARDGIECAMLAAAGAHANRAAFEGLDGWFQCYTTFSGDTDRALSQLGKPFEVISPGLAYKLYPCCADLHASVDAAIALRDRHKLRPGDIKSIRCGITPLAANNSPYPRPTTPSQAKFSQEYCVATALVRGRLTLEEFTADAIRDPSVLALLPLIDAKIVPDLSGEDAVSFASPAIVEVETKTGDIFRMRVDEMLGHPKNPMSPETMIKKFQQCSAGIVGSAAAERASELIMKIDQLPNLDPLVHCLVQKTRP